MTDAQRHEQRLIDAAKALDVAIGPTQVRALLDFIAHLQRWNRTYNLTALRDAEQILVQHVFDSLAIVGPLRKQLQHPPRGTVDIVDVGSGGGLPGIVLAIACSDWQVRCIDAVEKKMAFVRQMAGVLRLSNLHAVHARVETLEALGADVVVSRALASLSDFAALAGYHVAQDGFLLAMKGREPNDEIGALTPETGWRVSRVESLIVPELTAQRCLVWMVRREGIV